MVSGRLQVSKILRIAFLAVGLVCLSPAGRSADALRLDDVLGQASAHPRLEASPGLLLGLPRRQPLFLGCHQLVFPHLEPDSFRDRPRDSLLPPLVAQQLEVMARFFDVLLADLSYASESEAMAVAYIQYDRALARSELGQYSDLRVLELESVYQKILHRRTASQVARQLTRSLLAESLGTPEDLPSDLSEPVLPLAPKDRPALGLLLAQAFETPGMRSLVADRGEADRRLIEMELRQQLLELLLRLDIFDAAAVSLKTESAWRDLKLDESRTLYEQEVTADLGYSMSQQTRTRLSERRLAYCRALTWAELQALLGRPVWPREGER